MTTPTGRRGYDVDGPEILRALGRIEGTLAGIEQGVAEAKAGVGAVNARLDGHVGASGRAGALMGTLAAGGIAVVVEMAKRWPPI
ncbi:hypothetical protein [uncultured Thiodictyon sp.]|uniref:hypothetical protein n=1 Tax=uncultured Thiodictyon sp. TaxID=1846217 RepID=UPI0025F17D60|nr:hypothetical protein [uncultured Thiodictyon sp.]